MTSEEAVPDRPAAPVSGTAAARATATPGPATQPGRPGAARTHEGATGVGAGGAVGADDGATGVGAGGAGRTDDGPTGVGAGGVVGAAAGRSPGGFSGKRTKIVLGEVAARPAATDRARVDLAEQTPVGEALVKGLVRAQLALALRLSLVVVTGLGALPLLFAVAPAVGRARLLGVSLAWLLLGVAAFPFLVGVGWAYVRWAERNEQDFTAVIRRPDR